GSATDDDLREPDDARGTEHLLDALLVVAGVGLFDEHPARDPLEPAVELALDDLRERRLRLALVAGLGGERLALGVDLALGDVVAGEVRGAAEGDVDGDVMGEVLPAALQLDQDAVDAAPVLDV